MPEFTEIWRRIERHQGEEFRTRTGLPFTYEVQGDIFRSDRANQDVSRMDFERALAIAPFDGPGNINRQVRGPACIRAVLHDPRIRKDDYQCILHRSKSLHNGIPAR